MNDNSFDAMLSSRLKRANADVAQAATLNLASLRSSAWPQRATEKHWPHSPFRSRLGIAVALVVAIALASGTAYAGITLFQAVIQTDPGAAAVYRQNLGEALDLSQTRDGVTLTLVRAYADINRVMITYQVKPTEEGSVFAGFATSNGQPAVTDLTGQTLLGYDAYFETDPQTNLSAGTLVYDAEAAAQNVRELSLRVAAPGVRISRKGDSTIAGPFAFNVRVPLSSGETVTVSRAVTAHGIKVTLDRVVASPSETRVYIGSSQPVLLTGSFLTARITGAGSDTMNEGAANSIDLVDMGAAFRAPDGQEVVTFTKTLFGRKGVFTLAIGSVGAGGRIAGPWVFVFHLP